MAHIPTLELNVNPTACVIQKGLEAGFFHFLTKPINELISTLDAVLKLRKNQLFAYKSRPPTLDISQARGQSKKSSAKVRTDTSGEMLGCPEKAESRPLE